MTHFFMWLGHDHHEAKREQAEREQQAVDEARLIAAHGLLIEEGDDG